MIKINLKQILNDKKMPQSELAALAKIRPSTISDLCNNNCQFLKLEQLETICNILHCSIPDILQL